MQALVLVSLLLAVHPHKNRIAVLDVQDVSGDQATHAKLLTQIITSEVLRDGTIEVISANQIRQMLGFEKQKQLLGCNEGSCLAEIGGALGVDFLLTSELSKLGSQYRLDLSLVDQERAHTEATVGEFLPAQDDALADTTVKLVNQLLIKSGLRQGDSKALDAAISATAPVSHKGAYVAFGIAAALAVGAGVMTGLTAKTFGDAEADYQANGTYSVSSAGDKLGWMGPLTDALWAGAVVAAGTGTILYFTARPSGAGGEVGLSGSF